MFEKQYKGEEVIYAQDEQSVRTALYGYYKDLDLIIKEMKAQPEKWVGNTSYARYRWSKTGVYVPVKIRANGEH